MAKNRVGNANPTPEAIADQMARLGAMAKESSSYTVNLSSDERIHTVKFPPAGERIVELVAGLAEKHGVALPSASPDGVRADLKLAQMVRPAAQQAQSYADTLKDTALLAESECWWGTTALYTALVRASASDPKLADDLRPALDFFRVGRRRKKEEAEVAK